MDVKCRDCWKSDIYIQLYNDGGVARPGQRSQEVGYWMRAILGVRDPLDTTASSSLCTSVSTRGRFFKLRLANEEEASEAERKPAFEEGGRSSNAVDCIAGLLSFLLVDRALPLVINDVDVVLDRDDVVLDRGPWERGRARAALAKGRSSSDDSSPLALTGK